MLNEIICGDCLEVMPRFPQNTFDGIITDPPYGLGFMGKEWDTFKDAGGSGTDWKSKERFKCINGSTRKKNWSRASNAGSYDLSRNAEFQQWFTVWAKEALRICKPGAIMLIFGGTRTSHRLTCAIEDAGWQIRDCMMWLYGSGFPKSHNISKAIDKAAPRKDMFEKFAKHLRQQLKASGKSHKDIAFNFKSKTGGLTGCVWNWENGLNVPTLEQWQILQPMLGLSDEFLPLIKRVETEREIIGKKKKLNAYANEGGYKAGQGEYSETEISITVPATDLAKLWDGYGTALKPAWEPIIVAMKPLDGTFAANAEKWGVAGLNIDLARIPTEKNESLVEKDPLLSIFGNASFDTPESCADFLRHISFGLRKHSIFDTIPLHNEDGQDDNLLSDAQCELLLTRLYPNGVWCGLKLCEVPDFQSDCQSYSCSCDELVRYAQEAAQENAPLLGDALERIALCLPEPSRIHGLLNTVHLSSEDVFRHIQSLCNLLNKLLLHSTTKQSALSNKKLGRWPANLILDEEAAAEAGEWKRYFYCPKASRAERNAGLEGMEEKRPDDRTDVGKGIWVEKGTAKQTNHHPTVKPLALMEYLCTLLKPPTEHPILLDPFCGSGTTLIAAANTGWDYIGIEKEKEYCEIAEKRVAYVKEQGQDQMALFKK